MEIKIKVIDIFPAINELSKDNDLIIYINEIEYLLKDIINKEFSLLPCSLIKVLIKKENPNQILGEGKIELNKILLINSSKNIITWLKLSKEKKIKKNNNIKNEILNNIFDFLKIKIHLTILNKEKHKTTFISIDNFNKIQNNKEILKSKSPALNKFLSIYPNNTLFKSYNGKIHSKNLTRNEINNFKSISSLNKTKKKKNRTNSIIYKKEKMTLSNIFGKKNSISNSFIDNDEYTKYNERTHSKKSHSKTSKIINNKLKKKIFTEKKIKKFDGNISYDVNNLKKNLNNIKLFHEDNFLNENNDNNFNNEIKDNSKEHFESKNIDAFGSIEIMDMINKNNDINLKDINDDELNKPINNLIIKQKENLIDNNQDDNLKSKIEEKLLINQDNKILINPYNNSDNNEINENIEENSIDDEFLGLKNDFEIFYTKDYLENINNDFFKLEIELCFEKVFELILSYHNTLKAYELKINFEQRKINEYISKIKNLNKQLSKIKILNKGLNNNKDYIDICNIIKQNKINLVKKNCQNELDLFKIVLLQTNNNKYVKLKNIFSKIYLNHHHKIIDSETKTIIKTIFPDLSITHKKFLPLEISNQNKKKNLYSNFKTFSSYNKYKNISNKSFNINNNIYFTDSKKSKISNYSGNTTVTNDFKY